MKFMKSAKKFTSNILHILPYEHTHTHTHRLRNENGSRRRTLIIRIYDDKSFICMKNVSFDPFNIRLIPETQIPESWIPICPDAQAVTCSHFFHDNNSRRDHIFAALMFCNFLIFAKKKHSSSKCRLVETFSATKEHQNWRKKSILKSEHDRNIWKMVFYAHNIAIIVSFVLRLSWILDESNQKLLNHFPCFTNWIA